MSFFTDINVMYLIVIDGIIGLILMRDKKLEYLGETIQSLIGSIQKEVSINKFKLKENDILYISSDGRESIELGGIYGGTKSETEKLRYSISVFKSEPKRFIPR